MYAPDPTSTRPYLIRALYEWCTDNGYTPHIAVRVDSSVQVPQEFVKNGEIVLNIGLDATSALKLGNDYIEFKARFGGTAREIVVPVDRVIAIYSRENGQGMAFPVTEQAAIPAPQDAVDPGTPAQERTADAASKVVQLVPTESQKTTEDDEPPTPKPPSGSRPKLQRIK